MTKKSVGDLLEPLYAEGKRREVIRIAATATVREAAVLMHEKNINLLAVQENGKDVGVVTTSDTSGALVDVASSVRPSERMISEIMTHVVVTAKIDDDILGLPKKLDNKGHPIRHLVVVDENGNWIAILDSNEVMKAVKEYYEHLDSIEAYLKSEERRRD